jgi:hypothetical protein
VAGPTGFRGKAGQFQGGVIQTGEETMGVDPVDGIVDAVHDKPVLLLGPEDFTVLMFRLNLIGSGPAVFHIPHLLAEGPLTEKKNSRQWMRMEIFLCTPVGREFQKCNSGNGNRSKHEMNGPVFAT